MLMFTPCENHKLKKQKIEKDLNKIVCRFVITEAHLLCFIVVFFYFFC